jgi:hypothetical protein
MFVCACSSLLLRVHNHTYNYDFYRVEADCKATLRRLLEKGPPIWLEDKHGFPIPENGDTHVITLWFMHSNEERSAKLKGALEGEAREKLWLELKELMHAMEEEGSE